MIESPLLRNLKGYVNGRWTAADSGKTFEVHNPATGELLARVPDMAAAETSRAIDAADAAMRSDESADVRAKRLKGIVALLQENKPELARIITLEQGKPLKESLGEVDYATGFFQFYSDRLQLLDPHSLPQPVKNLKWTIYRRPAGVAALITPWNFPLALLAKKLAPAIGAGCAVVVKPAELTPLSTIAMWQLLETLNPPAGRFNLVMGAPAPIGDTMCTHPAVRIVSFTGSTEVGKLLISKTAGGVKRLSLELGGNAPFIVFDDADIDVAADSLMASKFRAGGQTCVCANRIYVQKSIEKKFLDAVVQRVAKLKVGNGIDPASDIGPLIAREGFEKVSRHVSDALSKGAMRVLGSDPTKPTGGYGYFYPPTVLTGATAQMQLSQEETFGPVVAIQTFDSEDQAIDMANATPYGLAGYLFSKDPKRLNRVASRVRSGHIGANTGSGPTPEAPFGGMKQSGFGREGGEEGLFEFTETQTVATA